MRAIVYHSSYGCDTGCCGHVVELQDNNGVEFYNYFTFNHPNGKDHRAFAAELLKKELGEEHVKDLDWDNCVISDD